MNKSLIIYNQIFTIIFLCFMGNSIGSQIDPPIICIDIGDTHTHAAIFNEDHVEFIPFENGESSIPSVIGFGNEGLLVGKSALNFTVNDSDETYTIFDLKDLLRKLYQYPKHIRNKQSLEIKQIHKSLIEDKGNYYFNLYSKFKNNRNPFGNVTNFKSKMNQTKSLFTWEELASLFLTHIKDQAENFLGLEVKTSIFTVPSYFSDEQRVKIKAAAELAGLSLLRMLNQPTAAGIAHQLDNIKKETNVLVYRMGGKRLDIDYVQVDSFVQEIIYNISDEGISGERINERILELIIRKKISKELKDYYSSNTTNETYFDGIHNSVYIGNSNNKHYPDNSVNRTFVDDNYNTTNEVDSVINLIFEKEFIQKVSDPSAYRKIMRKIEEAKIILSNFPSNQTLTPIPILIGELELFPSFGYINETITTDEFNQICEGFFELIVNHTEKMLLENNLNKTEIHKVILAGGSMKTPHIQIMFKKFFPSSEILMLSSPEKTAAQGAANLSAVFLRETVETPLCVPDCYPLNIGYEGEFGSMEVIINKNSVIPLIRKQNFTTHKDFQEKLELKIYEGQRALARDNRFLGSLVLDALPRRKAKEISIETRWEIDENAVIIVRAIEYETRNTAEVRFLPENGLDNGQLEKILSEEEANLKEDEIIKNKIKTLKEFKIYLNNIEDYLIQNNHMEEEFYRVKIKETKLWLDSSPDNLIKADVEKVIREFKTSTEPLYKELSKDKQIEVVPFKNDDL